MLEHALLAQQAVAAQGESIVGGIDDDGVVRLAGLFQGFENPPDLAVQMRDHSVVFRQLIADDGLGPRPGGQVLVAAALHHAVVEGKLRQEVGGQRRQVPVVHLPKRHRRHPRIVRRGEGHVGKEGLLPIVAAQELNHRIRKQLAGELLARALGGQLAVRAEVSDRHLGVVRHAAEHDGLSPLEGPQPGGLAVVPFAGAERHVAVLLQELGQELDAFEGRGIHVEPRLAAHQHRPAGHADGAAVAPEAVVGPEG